MTRITPQTAAERRAERRLDRIGGGVVGVLAVVVLWSVSHPGPQPSERLPACAGEIALPCRFVRADGVGMVRLRHPERGLEEVTADDFDFGYRNWQRETGPDCPGVGPMSAC